MRTDRAAAPAGAEALPTQFPYQPALDGLRAIAVGAVIAYHFGGDLPGGFLGVDTFFVLSGYLITSLLLVEWGRHHTVRFGAFWARRARRLLPALLLVLVAVAVWASLAARTDQLASLRADSLWTLFYGANWHFVESGQSYFALFSEASPLRHAWSLAIEEQFYLLWPLITFVSLRAGRGRPRVLATVCVVGTVASAVAMALLYDPLDPSRVYYGTDTRASALLIGALLAILLARWSPQTPGARVGVQALGAAGAVVCIVAFATIGELDSRLYEGGFVLFAVGTAAVIAAVVQPARTPLRWGLSLTPVRWIGQVSYGLYLWHWPVQIVLSEARTGLDGWSLALARLGLTFGAATVSYYAIELPVRRGVLRGWMARIAAPAGAASAALVIVVTTAGATRPPLFLRAEPNQVLKSEAPSTGPPPSAPPAPPGIDPALVAGLPPPRLLLLGDSVAFTLGDSLASAASARGIEFRARTRPGCGMFTGLPVLPDGTPVAWGPTCDEATVSFQQEQTAQSRATAVLVLDSWATSDRIVDGEVVPFGTAAGDAMTFAKLDEVRANVTARGARLVLLTLAPPAASSEHGPADPVAVQRIQTLNRLLRDYAGQRPENVTLVDLARIVCPIGPPCPVEMDGVVLRPRDGGHFEGGGAEWVAPRLLDQVMSTLYVAGTGANP